MQIFLRLFKLDYVFINKKDREKITLFEKMLAIVNSNINFSEGWLLLEWINHFKYVYLCA